MSKSKRVRRKFSNAFKAKVALEALKERKTLSELAKEYELHPSQITTWKRELLEKSSQVFAVKPVASAYKEADIDRLYSKIGKLEMERDFLKKSLSKLGWTQS